MDLTPYEKKITSQSGEDGITMQLLSMIYTGDNKDKFYVEFGVENGHECNTRILRDIYNWNGLQMDGGYENNSINLKREFITKDNIVPLFKKYNVPQNINVLSIDIDYNDFYCLHEILKEYKCDIIICEYNATHLYNEDKVIQYNEKFMGDGTNYFGASLFAYHKLAKKYNYSLVACTNNGVNFFLVHNDIIVAKNLQFKDIDNIEKLYKSAKYGTGPNGGHCQDPHNRSYISSDEAMLL